MVQLLQNLESYFRKKHLVLRTNTRIFESDDRRPLQIERGNSKASLIREETDDRRPLQIERGNSGEK